MSGNTNALGTDYRDALAWVKAKERADWDAIDALTRACNPWELVDHLADMVDTMLNYAGVDHEPFLDAWIARATWAQGLSTKWDEDNRETNDGFKAERELFDTLRDELGGEAS